MVRHPRGSNILLLLLSKEWVIPEIYICSLKLSPTCTFASQSVLSRILLTFHVTSPNTSLFFALRASNVCLVGEGPDMLRPGIVDMLRPGIVGMPGSMVI